MRIQLTPRPNCIYCHGTGKVYDTVDYGSTTAQLESLCSCIEAQIPESFDDRTYEIEIVFPAPEPEYEPDDSYLEGRYEELYETDL